MEQTFKICSVRTRPQPSDVLFGRGVAINNHEGNVQFRKFVEERKCDFLLAARKKKEKANIARDVFSKVHSLGGRFLEHVKITSTLSFWHEVNNTQANEKCMQALRSTKRGMTESQVEAAKNKALERQKEQEPERTEKESLAQPNDCVSACDAETEDA